MKKRKQKEQDILRIEQNSAVLPEQVEIELDELASTPKRRRIWEVDFLRGLMILFVVWDHLMWDFAYFGNNGGFSTEVFKRLYDFASSYQNGVLRATTHDTFVAMFVLTSGISCSFSRSNGKRAIKMIIFACLLTAGTSAVTAITNSNFTIRFNVIHAIALSTLLWTLIEFCWSKCSRNWQKNIFGWCMAATLITVLVVGYSAKVSPWTNENPVWFFIAQHNTGKVTAYRKFIGGDYLPFFPAFGWFLLGAFLGRIFYRERKTMFPSVNHKYLCPVTFCGRHSLWVYFGSQIVMYGLIYLFSVVFGIL